MPKKNKDKMRARPVNMKINTRIVISSVLCIVVPIIIIGIWATYFASSISSYFDISSVNTNSYSLINQIQWYQTISGISDVLTSSSTDEKKLESIEKTASQLEAIGSYIYIEKGGEVIYCTTADESSVFENAAAVADFDSSENAYYFTESGLLIVNHARADSGSYLILITGNNYSVPDISQKSQGGSVTGKITANTIIFCAVIAVTFILSITIISLMVSKTIITPIKKIMRGANEIANGNLDYKIDYESTNELGQLSQSFNTMRLRIKESNEKQAKADMRQKQMIAGLAHDLRTPLTSVKGYVEGLRDGIADTPEKQKRYIDIIYSSTCDTQKMLDDLFTISNLELGGITLSREKVTIDDVTNYAREIAQELAESDFDFEINNYTKTNPVLSVDTDKFVRVIDNIISNSVKYRKQGVRGKITLTVSEYTHTVIFEIKDNGMGVDQESLPQIFDMSFRADKARTNVRDGSGLGLAVCKEIVELHGGMIWAQSELGQGLSIFISLPTFGEQEP
ncbi:MAG: HAMP domain-containing histidine kinase [Clostridiales bacterium]|nr:HAMP domain-containing histidine kinase [Clostridiales bacterium]